MQAFAIVLCLVLISSTVVFWKASEVTRKLAYLQESRVPQLVTGDALTLDITKTRSCTRRVLISVAAGKMEKAKSYQKHCAEEWTAGFFIDLIIKDSSGCIIILKYLCLEYIFGKKIKIMKECGIKGSHMD